jgi:hypothetical protein
VLLVRRGVIFLAVVVSAAVGFAKPGAMDGAVNAWEQLAAKVATFSR